jgi:hypothetical protein
MSPVTWMLAHLFGILLLFTSLGALLGLQPPPAATDARTTRTFLRAVHGIALLVVVGGGLGLMAQLGIHGRPPGWITLKLGVWLLLGAAPVLIARVPGVRPALVLALPILGLVSAWAALTKPF